MEERYGPDWALPYIDSNFLQEIIDYCVEKKYVTPGFFKLIDEKLKRNEC